MKPRRLTLTLVVETGVPIARILAYFRWVKARGFGLVVSRDMATTVEETARLLGVRVSMFDQVLWRFPQRRDTGGGRERGQTESPGR